MKIKYGGIIINKKIKEGMGDAQWMWHMLSNPDHLTSISRTHIKREERTDFQMLSSYFHMHHGMHTPAHAHHTQTHTYTQSLHM